MRTIVAVLAIVVLGGAVLLAVFALLRGFLQSIRRRKPLPYEPMPETMPLVPVVPTVGVSVTAVAAVVWCVIHVAAILWWAIAAFAFGRDIPQGLYTGLVATYVAVGSLLTGVGGLLLIRANAHGRRSVAWGEFLLGLFSFLGGVITMLLWQDEETASSVRRLAPYLSVGCGLHVLIDALIGGAAQRVGCVEKAAGQQTHALEQQGDASGSE